MGAVACKQWCRRPSESGDILDEVRRQAHDDTKQTSSPPATDQDVSMAMPAVTSGLQVAINRDATVSVPSPMSDLKPVPEAANQAAKASVDDKLATDIVAKSDEEAVLDTVALYRRAQACVCTAELACSSRKALAWEDCESAWAAALGVQAEKEFNPRETQKNEGAKMSADTRLSAKGTSERDLSQSAQGPASKFRIYEDAQFAANKVDAARSSEKAQRWKECDLAWSKAMNLVDGSLNSEKVHTERDIKFTSSKDTLVQSKKPTVKFSEIDMVKHHNQSDESAAASLLSLLTVAQFTIGALEGAKNGCKADAWHACEDAWAAASHAMAECKTTESGSTCKTLEATPAPIWASNERDTSKEPDHEVLLYRESQKAVAAVESALPVSKPSAWLACEAAWLAAAKQECDVKGVKGKSMFTINESALGT